MTFAVDSLPLFRARWAERFTDTCLARDVTGTVLNESTGVNEPTYTTRYSGPCQIRPASEGEAVYGQRLVVTFSHVLHLPWDATGPGPGTSVEVTSATDPRLTGRQFTVRGIPNDTLLTHRILFLEENQGA